MSVEQTQIDLMKGRFSDIPDNRLEGDGPLRQTQLIMLRLLKIFHQICERNNLCYWLDSGTLLGAVRHGGFIPWDDDIDVNMPFEDYVKFINLPETEFPADVFLQTPETDVDYICPFIKLRDRFSWIEEAGGPYPYSQAAFLDIFPKCTLTPNQLKHRRWYAFLPPYSIKPERIVKHLSLKSKIRILIQGNVQRLFIGLTKIPFIRKKLCSYFEKGRGEGQEVIQSLYPIRFDEIVTEKMIFPLKKIKFEDAEFYGPNDPDACLKSQYGDYMKLPPEEKRHSEHNVTAFFPTGPNTHFSALRWEDFYNEDGTRK